MKLALPKGRLLPPTSELLNRAGLGLIGYDGQSRSYRPECNGLSGVFLKIFNEKDIPIQVAIGNYDLGICGGDWVEELLARYPSSALVRIRDLGYGESSLYVGSSRSDRLESTGDLKARAGTVRIATEFPNLAESFALGLRLRRFRIFPLWGAAEAYPPENADLALVSLPSGRQLDPGLFPLSRLLSSSAFLIAHRPSWESRDVSALLDRLYEAGSPQETGTATAEGPQQAATPSVPSLLRDSDIRLALPDGHQQEPTLDFLNRAGVRISQDGPDPHRPAINVDSVGVKIIRPQDMPLQVANGYFDLAITGQDWLYEHLCRFPSSPVKEIMGLGFGKVRIVAVVSNSIPAEGPRDLTRLLAGNGPGAMRVASEYTNIADKYARDNHLSPYRLVPTWGASEAFLPEDADVLIENVQTGRTLAQHNLKIIDTIFESSACLIGNANPVRDRSKAGKMDRFIRTMQQAIIDN